MGSKDQMRMRARRVGGPFTRQVDHPFTRRAGRFVASGAAVLLMSLALSDARLQGGPSAHSEESRLAVAPQPGAAGAPFVPRQVLMRLAPGGRIDDINRRYGTEILGRVESEPIFLLLVPAGKSVDQMVSQMTLDPTVEVCEPNYRFQNPEAQGSSMTFADPSLDAADHTDQEALARIRAKEAWSFARGQGVTVAILDTGVEAGHPQLTGHIASGGWDFVDRDANPADSRDGIDSDNDDLVDEAAGHGTFVAGLVLSVAPRSAILPIRVLDSDGRGTAFNLARGIELAHRRGARVINMSLGMDTPSGVVDELIERFKGSDFVFVASAGNRNVEQPQQFPARDSYVIGVAATNRFDRKAGFSNFGSWVDVSAPGVGLVSSFRQGSFARWSGTSFAAGLVSGEAALLFSKRPGARFNDIVDAIERSAVDIDDRNPAFEGELGEGRIDVLAAMRLLLQD